MSGARGRSSIRLIQWMMLAGITWSLHLAGRATLTGPPLVHPDRFLSWWQGRGAVLATFSITREVLFCVGGYLCLLWTAALIASSIESFRLLRTLWRCRLPGAQVLVTAMIGASTVGTVVMVGAAPSFANDDTGPAGVEATTPATQSVDPPTLRYSRPADPPPVLRRVTSTQPSTEPPSSEPATTSTPPSTEPAPVSTEPAPAPAPRPATSTPPATRPASKPARLPSRPNIAPSLPAAAHVEPVVRWTVRPGDDLWSIAAAAITQGWGYPPSDAALGQYWWQVIQANRAHLPDPDDPNLLFPGDVVSLPRPPPAPH